MSQKILASVILVTVLLAVTAVAGATSNVVFYTPAWGIDYAEEIIALFEEEYPDVTVELIRGPSEWDGHVGRMTLWLRTQYEGVDVLYNDDVFVLDGAYYDVWEELTPYLSEEEIDDLIGLQLEYRDIHDGIYRIPWWNGMSYMYYRKDLFEEAGLAVPTTWDEFLEVAQALTKDTSGDGEIDQWGYLTQGTPGEMYNNFCEFLYQAGGDEWELAPDGVPDPRAVEALTFMTELYSTTAPPGLSAIGYDMGRSMVREGKAAMFRDWADMGVITAEEGLEDLVGVMHFPAGPAGPYAVAHCWGVVVNKHGANFKQNPDAVIDFVRFMMRPEIHAITAAIEGPALHSVLSDEAYMARLAEANAVIPYFDEFIEFRRVRNFPPGESTPYHEGIGRIVTKAAITQEVGIEEALIELQEWIDPLIEEHIQ